MKKIKIIIFIITLIFISLCSLFFYSVYYLPENFSVNHLEIKNSLISKSLNEFKILYFADLNFGINMKVERFEKLCDLINLQQPDIIIFGGDLLAKEVGTEMQDYIAKKLKNLYASKGKFYLTGDKDDKRINSVVDIMQKAQFENIDNKIINIHALKQAYFQIGAIKDPKQASNLVTEDQVFKIYLSHYPENIDLITHQSNHLYLAAHTLGGLVNIPPFGSFEYFDHSNGYINGQYQLDNQSILYVSSGASSDKADVRLGSVNEILLIKLYRE